MQYFLLFISKIIKYLDVLILCIGKVFFELNKYIFDSEENNSIGLCIFYMFIKYVFYYNHVFWKKILVFCIKCLVFMSLFLSLINESKEITINSINYEIFKHLNCYTTVNWTFKVPSCFSRPLLFT